MSNIKPWSKILYACCMRYSLAAQCVAMCSNV
nr:MAG TPA: hypothetical protein [Caudoviricetes sp.]